MSHVGLRLRDQKQSSSFGVLNSDTRGVEARKVRPLANLPGVPANANKHAVRWRRAIEDEQLVPPGWRDVRVWGRGDGTSVARARKRGEDSAAAHRVAVSARHGRNERDAERLALELLHVDLVLPAVFPVLV